MVIEFKVFGPILATRTLGVRVRKEILGVLFETDLLTFDMEGVEILSNSFADECFAKLLDDIDFNSLRKTTTFINTNSTIQGIVSYAFKERLSSVQPA